MKLRTMTPMKTRPYTTKTGNRFAHRAGKKRKRAALAFFAIAGLGGCESLQPSRSSIDIDGGDKLLTLKFGAATPVAPVLSVTGSAILSVDHTNGVGARSIKIGLVAPSGLPALSSIVVAKEYARAYNALTGRAKDAPMVQMASLGFEGRDHARKVFKSTMDKGADIFQIDAYGNSVLHAAAQNYNQFVLEIVVEYLKNHPSQDRVIKLAKGKNVYGKTPIDGFFKYDLPNFETLASLYAWSSKESKEGFKKRVLRKYQYLTRDLDNVENYSEEYVVRQQSRKDRLEQILKLCKNNE